MAFSDSGSWNGQDVDYTYAKETAKLKMYTVEGTSEVFGNVKRDVISAVPDSDGAPRFYVMALNDVDDVEHYWYKNANINLINVNDYDMNDFGQGREYTDDMIQKWNSASCGETDENDMWGVIQKDEIKAKYPLDTWFVPSYSEWSAFGALLWRSVADGGFGVDSSNYSTFNLKDYYWTSVGLQADGSTLTNCGAFKADFPDGYVDGSVLDRLCVYSIKQDFLN